MSEPIKSSYPVQTRIIAPINEGSNYVSKSYIQFKINASELPMWIVATSYLSFNIKYTRKEYQINKGADGNTNLGINKSYIRNAANIFDLIKVRYGGDDIYTQTFNIEQNTLKTLTLGNKYLDANFATYSTNENIKEGEALLEFDNGTAKTNNAETIEETTKTIKNVIIPVNKLIPLFQDVGSNGFPIGKLKRQLEINLYIAEPYRFIVDYDNAINDFTSYFRRAKSSNDSVQPVCDVPIMNRFPSGSIKLENVRLVCDSYVPTNEEDAIISSTVNGEGMKFRYNLWHIGVREISRINSTNDLPFSVVTENTNSFLIYSHETQLSPSLMFRPYIDNLYLRFGEMQLPLQPIPGDTFTTPIEYKHTAEKVLNNIDTYFSLTNEDFNRSYQFVDNDLSGTNLDEKYKNNFKPSSNFVLMGATFTSSNDILGSPSSRWNHQYQIHFGSKQNYEKELRFILGVNTEYGLIIKNGDLLTINI